MTAEDLQKTVSTLEIPAENAYIMPERKNKVQPESSRILRPKSWVRWSGDKILHKDLRKTRGTLTILHHNIQSVRNKTLEIEVFLNELSQNGIDINLICFTEHWLNLNEVEYFSINNNVVINHFCRDQFRCGGL